MRPRIPNLWSFLRTKQLFQEEDKMIRNEKFIRGNQVRLVKVQFNSSTWKDV